ncbi:MAG: PA0069 family radical SAM protein [Ignavibacteriales bacterium]|nr:PA0069 family radical SAM protein [Ignavibacteriales bacterium]
MKSQDPEIVKPHAAPHGRGAGTNPQNRFESTSYEVLEEEIDAERKITTKYFRDTSKTILAKNDSPDIGFSYDLNPYRGCEHGCIYCYARPSHEYLGFSAGLDFETKIMVKPDAHILLEKEFKKKSWRPTVIALSGNTDCYQPIERKLQLTRKCLEVFLKYRNPVGMITKNALITRDIDIIAELAKLNLVVCTLTIPTLDKALQRVMEPRTSPSELRLDAIEQLAKAGIPVGVSLAPVIPGLNDSEMPAILKRASEHGATFAFYTMLRLPYAVKDLFTDWLKREMPQKAEKILNRIKDVREGKLNSTEFGTRMTGTGEIAESIRQLFELTCAKYHFNEKRNRLSVDKFLSNWNAQTELDFD